MLLLARSSSQCSFSFSIVQFSFHYQLSPLLSLQMKPELLRPLSGPEGLLVLAITTLITVLGDHLLCAT